MHADGNKWLAYAPPLGQSKTGALDFSWLNDGPVGNHGFVIPNGDKFTFENETYEVCAK